MKLIVGLGNPGKIYEQTRHNVGFLVVDELKRRGVSAHLLKPKTFMNRSGEAVVQELAYYKISLDDLIVVHDDADLPFGIFKMEKGRGSAGHNGVASIMEALGGRKDFLRVRVGIGRPESPEILLEDWVLGMWSKEERTAIEKAVEHVADELQKILV